MKPHNKILLLFFLLATSSLAAQTVQYIFTSKDAMIRRFQFSVDTTNHGDYEYINMHAWTNNGSYVVHRSLIEFDLSSVSHDTLQTATLKLYSDIHSTFYPNGHNYCEDFPKNELIINQITEEWEEDEVHWANRPGVSFKNEVFVPAGIDHGFQDYEIDVTDMVLEMLADPVRSHGFMIQLFTEWYHVRTVFASSDNPSPEFHPRLEIISGTVKINEEGVLEQFRIYPNPSSGEIKIEFEKNDLSIDQVIIYNQSGQKVLTGELVNNTIEVASLQDGMYIVEIISEDLRVRKKFIKQ